MNQQVDPQSEIAHWMSKAEQYQRERDELYAAWKQANQTIANLQLVLDGLGSAIDNYMQDCKKHGITLCADVFWGTYQELQKKYFKAKTVFTNTSEGRKIDG